jgi:predicted aspartyl protease
MTFSIFKLAAVGAAAVVVVCSISVSGLRSRKATVDDELIIQAISGQEVPSTLERLSMKLGSGDDRALILRGVLSSYYLRDDQASEHLAEYLRLHQEGGDLAAAARYWLAVTHLRSGRYADAYAELTYGDDSSTSDQAVGSIKCLAKALSGMPAMQASTAEPTAEMVERYKSGHLLVPAIINGVHLDFIPDTGAAISFISETKARELSIKPLTRHCSVMTPGGRGVVASFGLASVKFGNVRVSNAVFGIIPDAAARIGGIDFQPFVGLPVLARAGSVSMALSGDGAIFATGGSKKIRPELRSNMFVSAFTLKSIVSVNGRNLIFDVDTGSNRTMIYPSERTSYLGRHISEVSTLRAYTMSGGESPLHRYGPLTFSDGMRARTMAGALEINGAMQQGSDGRLGLDVLIDKSILDFRNFQLEFDTDQ